MCKLPLLLLLQHPALLLPLPQVLRFASKFLLFAPVHRRAAQGSYTNLWLTRCILIASHRSSRIFRLVVDEEITAAKFAKSFPDTGGRARRLWRRGRFSAQAGLHHCGYYGPPKLFSTIACFCADPAVQRIPVAALSQPAAQAQLSKLRAAYHCQHEQAPHPAVLLQLWAQQASQ